MNQHQKNIFDFSLTSFLLFTVCIQIFLSKGEIDHQYLVIFIIFFFFAMVVFKKISKTFIPYIKSGMSIFLAIFCLELFEEEAFYQIFCSFTILLQFNEQNCLTSIDFLVIILYYHLRFRRYALEIVCNIGLFLFLFTTKMINKSEEHKKNYNQKFNEAEENFKKKLPYEYITRGFLKLQLKRNYEKKKGNKICFITRLLLEIWLN